MNYLADPGGRFDSDVHRRVLGHLSTPTDNYGWSVPALVARMVPDVGTDIQGAEEMSTILGELEQDGHAERLQAGGQEVWRMTQQGFDVLTGSIANEPPEGALASGPAVIGVTAATLLEPTQIGVNGAANPPA